jgi:hypothetical protein
MVSTVLKLNETELLNDKPENKLELVPGKRQLPACYLDAKAKLKTRITPEFIFNSLTQTQRNIVIYAAHQSGGFTSRDSNKSFDQFTSDQCIKIQKALVELGTIKSKFADANVLQMARFTHGKPTAIYDDTHQINTDYLLTNHNLEPH